MDQKRTVIIGATTNQARYAYFVAAQLEENGHEFIPIGIKKGSVFNKEILNLHDKPQIAEVDTVTLYLNPAKQKPWEDYILSINPKRIIFNPGTENSDLASRANEIGIETINACTLTMLSVGLY